MKGRVVMTILLLILCSALVAWLLPFGMDWTGTYRPATLQIMRGDSPYEESGFYSPPWLAVPLLPIALLPARLGRGVVFVFSLIIFAAAAHRLKATLTAVVVLLLSPVVIHGLLNANVDAVVLLGLFVPPRWGLFFVSVKPQVGIGLLPWWVSEAWRENRWRGVAQLTVPITLATLLSFVMYGFWPQRARYTSTYTFSASLFPYGVPFGLVMLGYAILHREERSALASSPFFAPYLLFHSWVGALLGICHRERWLIAVVVALWLWVIFIAWRSAS